MPVLSDKSLGNTEISSFERENPGQGGAPTFDAVQKSLDSITIEPELFSKLDIESCKRFVICPLFINSDCLFFATVDKSDFQLLLQVEWHVDMQASFMTFSKQEILDKLYICERGIDQLGDVSEEFKLELVVEDGDEESYKRIDSIGEETVSPIINFINTLVLTGLGKLASDIHVETHEFSITAKYRIDGQLVSATEALDKSYHSAFVSRLKVMSDLDIAEKRIPQDGRFKLRVNGKDIDFRISVLPGIFGENVVIRILDNSATVKKSGTFSLEGLGIEDRKLAVIRRLVREPYGMILVTGPTGSGKTTTLYAALSEINGGQEKIITIEDPVEYQLEGVLQIPVNEKKGLTFASGLRSILRHDPDKILVGEIRDFETANIAIQSALTGHVVFSSVHANNAIDVLARLQNMNIDIPNCLSALNAVIAQRLVRKICEHCIDEVIYSEKKLTELDLSSNEFINREFYKGKGCQACDMTGYKGRTVISEVMVVDETLKQSVLENNIGKALLGKIRYVNDENLRRSAINKALEGITTLEEVSRVTYA